MRAALLLSALDAMERSPSSPSSLMSARGFHSGEEAAMARSIAAMPGSADKRDSARRVRGAVVDAE